MKKIRMPEIKAGIWLDQEKAYIIRIVGSEYPIVEKIKSDVESRVRFPGQVKAFTQFGNSRLDNQEKKQRRQRNQRHQYFKTIINSILDVNYIFLFGPSEARHELNNEIEKIHSLKEKVIAIRCTDRMSQEQMVQTVLNFFDSDEFRKYKRNLKKQNVV
jgi:hypothetical protein